MFLFTHKMLAISTIKKFICLSRIVLNGNLKNIQYNISVNYAEAAALRPTKPKSQKKETSYFVDSKTVRTVGGKGGDGCISFLQLWCNEKGGPDGGDGGNGGHVIFQTTNSVRNLNHISSNLHGNSGISGSNKDRNGKSADHTIIKVPTGTIIRNKRGCIVADLDREGVMFVASRGGAGGKGNRFFSSAKEKSPKICEYGPGGEDNTYKLELRSMADVGLIGLPNAGKSTLLNAITRANPKVASYPFTTLRPHIGVVQFEDDEKLSVADLPGLIEGSHENKGLGLTFLKHAERCDVLTFVLDATNEKPWEDYDLLVYEVKQFSNNILKRPQIIVANKIDDPAAKKNYTELKKRFKVEVIPISAKVGVNLSKLLQRMRQYCNREKECV